MKHEKDNIKMQKTADTYKTFEPPKEKHRIQGKSIAKIVCILLVIITMVVFIGGKTYKINVNESGQVTRTGTPPPTLQRIIEHFATIPQVNISELYNTSNGAIYGGSIAIKKLYEINYSNSDILGTVKFIAKALEVYTKIMVTIVVLPLTIVWNILTLILWIISMPFVL